MLLQQNTTTAPTAKDYKKNADAKIAIIRKVIKAEHHSKKAAN